MLRPDRNEMQDAGTTQLGCNSFYAIYTYCLLQVTVERHLLLLLLLVVESHHCLLGLGIRRLQQC